MTDVASLPDGLIAIVKRDCPTCEMVAPVLQQISEVGHDLAVYTQDDPDFPEGSFTRIDDTDLSVSWHHDIETVPTLIRVESGSETNRIVGWSRPQWEEFTGVSGLAPTLPEQRPGCGSLNVDPLVADALAVRFGGGVLSSRKIELAALEDEFEAAFDRGWTDGLPDVPPTESRVLRMLDGTDREPADVVAIVPPNLVNVTVEQVAINAVMAGCKPEYFPVVLAAVEAACTSEFNMHGLLCTTYFSGPIIIVNGPIADRIGMNSGYNVLGQGNRANLTIGRALQLVVRNIGGGRPGEVDQAMMGSPSKLGMCFAEREGDSPFTPLSVARGLDEGVSAVTLFAGQGPTPIVDQISRNPESLVQSFASTLAASHSTKLIIGFDALLMISPEHGRVFSDAGWDRPRLQAELEARLMLDGDTLIRGAGGIDEGLPEAFGGQQLPKFRPGGLNFVHAGGDAGMFSAVLTGWVGGAKGSELVTRPI